MCVVCVRMYVCVCTCTCTCVCTCVCCVRVRVLCVCVHVCVRVLCTCTCVCVVYIFCIKLFNLLRFINCRVYRSICQTGGYNIDVYVPPPATLPYDTLLTLVME